METTHGRLCGVFWSKSRLHTCREARSSAASKMPSSPICRAALTSSTNGATVMSSRCITCHGSWRCFRALGWEGVSGESELQAPGPGLPTRGNTQRRRRWAREPAANARPAQRKAAQAQRLKSPPQAAFCPCSFIARTLTQAPQNSEVPQQGEGCLRGGPEAWVPAQ